MQITLDAIVADAVKGLPEAAATGAANGKGIFSISEVKGTPFALLLAKGQAQQLADATGTSLVLLESGELTTLDLLEGMPEGAVLVEPHENAGPTEAMSAALATIAEQLQTNGDPEVSAPSPESDEETDSAQSVTEDAPVEAAVAAGAADVTSASTAPMPQEVVAAAETDADEAVSLQAEPAREATPKSPVAAVDPLVRKDVLLATAPRERSEVASDFGRAQAELAKAGSRGVMMLSKAPAEQGIRRPEIALPDAAQAARVSKTVEAVTIATGNDVAKETPVVNPSQETGIDVVSAALVEAEFEKGADTIGEASPRPMDLADPFDETKVAVKEADVVSVATAVEVEETLKTSKILKEDKTLRADAAKSPPVKAASPEVASVPEESTSEHTEATPTVKAAQPTAAPKGEVPVEPADQEEGVDVVVAPPPETKNAANKNVADVVVAKAAAARLDAHGLKDKDVAKAAESAPKPVQSVDDVRHPHSVATVDRTTTAETAKPSDISAAAPATRATAENVTEVTAQNVRYLVSEGGKVIKVRLIPESLGEMRVEVQSVDGVVNVRLISDNSSARNILQSQMSGLRQALAAEGIDVAHVTVVSDPGAAGGQTTFSWAKHSQQSPQGMRQEAGLTGGYRQNDQQASDGQHRARAGHRSSLNLFA